MFYPILCFFAIPSTKKYRFRRNKSERNSENKTETIDSVCENGFELHCVCFSQLCLHICMKLIEEKMNFNVQIRKYCGKMLLWMEYIYKKKYYSENRSESKLSEDGNSNVFGYWLCCVNNFSDVLNRWNIFFNVAFLYYDFVAKAKYLIRVI